MSSYSTQLRYICEYLAGLDESQGFNSVDNVIEKARPLIFDFDYPIFDERYKAVLETKILRQYYVREIGFETYGLFKLRLQAKMDEIMPMYNKLYKSELLKFNPFYDVDLTTTHELKNVGGSEIDRVGEVTSNSNTSSNNSSTQTSDSSGSSSNSTTDSRNTNSGQKDSRLDWDLESDTPQGSVSDLGLYNNSYMSKATKMIRDGSIDNTKKESGNTKGNTDFNGKERQIGQGQSSGNSNDKTNSKGNEVAKNNNLQTYLETVRGKRGGISYAKLLTEYRATFLNIDALVLNDLNDLFMLVW